MFHFSTFSIIFFAAIASTEGAGLRSRALNTNSVVAPSHENDHLSVEVQSRRDEYVSTEEPEGLAFGFEGEFFVIADTTANDDLESFDTTDDEWPENESFDWSDSYDIESWGWSYSESNENWNWSYSDDNESWDYSSLDDDTPLGVGDRVVYHGRMEHQHGSV